MSFIEMDFGTGGGGESEFLEGYRFAYNVSTSARDIDISSVVNTGDEIYVYYFVHDTSATSFDGRTTLSSVTGGTFELVRGEIVPVKTGSGKDHHRIYKVKTTASTVVLNSPSFSYDRTVMIFKKIT